MGNGNDVNMKKSQTFCEGPLENFPLLPISLRIHKNSKLVPQEIFKKNISLDKNHTTPTYLAFGGTFVLEYEA